MKVAIVGANGFVGLRLVENFVLRRVAEVVPIVRSFSSLAALARFDLPWKVCNVLDAAALAGAFQDCDAVVHAALGDPAQIVEMADSVYAAAQTAGVKRLVVLSSASVHGQNPASGTDEQTPIHDRQSMEYNNAKVRAERSLRKAREKGSVELVMLRPGIVYGPRSKMIAALVEKLIAGTAFFINDGHGICNGIYVDNFIHAIQQALEVEPADREAFLVGDCETVTWRTVYAALTESLGISLETVHRVSAPQFRRSFKEQIESFVATPVAQSILPAIPGEAKRLTKVMLAGLKPTPPANAWTLPLAPRAVIDEEMATLQQCCWKFPNQKAFDLLAYEPPISFEEGMKRTMAWLEFAGYPVTMAG